MSGGPLPRPSLDCLLEPRSIAVVGASDRPGSFGSRLVREVLSSPAAPTVHLVNRRAGTVAGLPALPSLDAVEGPVDLVLLAVPDEALEGELARAASRGDRAAVVYGAAYEPPLPGRPTLRQRLAATARGAGMALCGGGCMGYMNVTAGVRAIGYLERNPLPAGPVALVTHSGSVFSALLRTRRRLGFTLAVSSGQELVTTTGDYLGYALARPGTELVALVLETVHDAPRLRSALRLAEQRDVPVVALTVGTSERGAGLVTAHADALAGSDGAWEALFAAHGVHRVADLGELADTLELFAAGRRAGRGGLASVHDSGAERAHASDVAERVGVTFAEIGEKTRRRLAGLLDPGLVATNPLDLWGRGASTERLFSEALGVLADDPAVAALALAVDLVQEHDGDRAYRDAALSAHRATTKPLAVLANLGCALDEEAAAELRRQGIPVLEGTRSGLVALGHLLARAERRPPPAPPPADEERRRRWRERLGGAPLRGEEAFSLLADYGIPTVAARSVDSAETAVRRGEELGWPVVVKTDEPAVLHRSEVGGVFLDVGEPEELRRRYGQLAERFGPAALVAATAPPGPELALGVVADPLVGPLVVVGAGGVLAELLADRAVALPPLDDPAADALLRALRVAPLLAGWRGSAAVERAALLAALRGLSNLALELGGELEALDVNPLRCHPGGCLALDVLVVPRRREETQKIT